MTAKTLNRKLARARKRAYAREPELIAEYERQILAAGRQIAWRFSTRATSHLPEHALAAGADWTPPPHGSLFEPGVRPVAAGAIRKVQARILDESIVGARLGIAFDVKAPTSMLLLDQLGVRAGNIEENLRDPVAKAIADSYDAGATIPETAAAIRTVTSGLAGWQATMLARTDMIGLANGGAALAVDLVNESAAEAGEDQTFGTKTWVATMDEHTRETHAEADGQEVPIDDLFDVGDDQLDYPGDPNGSDEEVLNCRCTVIFSEGADALAAGADTLPAVEPVNPIKSFVRRPDSGANALSAGLTITIDDGAVVAPEDAFAPVGWRAILALEGVPTIDGRFFPVDSLGWRDLPLSLLAQTETQPGHDGAQVCGRIDRIWREPQPDGTTHIMGEGEFTGAEGAAIAPMVADESLRGLSVDVAVGSTALRNGDTGEIIDPDDVDLFDLMFGMTDLQTVMYDGVIGAATVCAFPAFDDATIAIVASGKSLVTVRTSISLSSAEALTAAAEGLAPEVPPGEWFVDPGLDRLTALTVTDEGRIVGHLAGWDTCHIGLPGTCTVAPNSQADYRYFHLGALTTAEGDEISVGKITLDTGHAGLSASRKNATRHYDDTGTAVADVRAGEDAFGIWVAGAVRPEVTASAVRKLRAASLSGDWRSIDNHLELVAALGVNVPGFPIPRAEAALAASGTLAMVAAGVVVTLTKLEQICSACGAAMDADATVCAECGAQVASAMSEDEMRTRLGAIALLSGVE